MKVVVLGVGKEGKIAVDDLVESGVQKIVIADYEGERAESVAKAYENEASVISPERVDANNREELVEVMEGADIVANTVGPFYEYGTKVLEAAMEAKVDFVDICDDSEPMKEQLDLDERARKSGITAMVGIGNNPGTGNLCAKYGADKLDEVEEINFYWVHPTDSETSRASLGHALEIFSGKVTTYREGKWVEVAAGTGKEEIEFPEPVGSVEVHHCGHPEPVTVPRYIEGVKKVSCKGGVTPVWANRDLRKLLDYGFASSDPIDVKGTPVIPRDFLESFLLSVTKGAPEKQGEKASRVVVKGKKDGSATSYAYDRIGRSWTAGLSLSIGVQMLARNEVQKKGVFPPEGCLDPRIFFRELRNRGLEIREKRVMEGISV